MSQTQASSYGLQKATGTGVLVESRCILWSANEAAGTPAAATVADNNTAGDGADTVICNVAASSFQTHIQGVPMDHGIKAVTGTVTVVYSLK